MAMRVPQFRRGSIAFEALVVATTAAVTAAITYKTASKRLEAQYDARLSEELEDTRKFFAALNEKPPLEDLAKGLDVQVEEETLETTADQMQVVDPRPPLGNSGGDGGSIVAYNRIAGNYNGQDDETADESDQTVEPTVRNVFHYGEMITSDTIPQEMIDARDEAVPYIITAEEYAESENASETWTFYADDAVLANEQEEPVDDISGSVGDETLSNFGLGSGDSRVVYVRNERIGMDYEILLHDGNYGEVVHGIPVPSPRRRTSAQEE
jgi:hypothetical protein